MKRMSLRNRQTEMRFQAGIPAREDLTLKLWTEMIEEDRANQT